MKSDGKMSSIRAKLFMVVIGVMRASMQSLSRKVGITSSEQVALLDESIAVHTSSVVAVSKLDGQGGEGETVVCRGDVKCGGKAANNLAILSLK